MNPRQRRGLLLLFVSLLGAIGVFAGLVSYTSDVAAQVGDKTTVLKLTTDVTVFQPVPANAVTAVEIPATYVTNGMITNVSDLVGFVASTQLSSGSYLDRTMLRTPPALDLGERELAILIDAETGVAGKVRQGDFVDIYATFKSDSAGGTENQARIIVRRALVLEIGDLRSETQSDGNGSFETQRAVPVTFALSVQESLVLAYAESFAVKVRLALTSPEDRVDISPEQRVIEGPQIAGGAEVRP